MVCILGCEFNGFFVGLFGVYSTYYYYLKLFNVYVQKIQAHLLTYIYIYMNLFVDELIELAGENTI